MGKPMAAPPSSQQAELIQNILRRPDMTSRYEGLALFHLTGSVDVEALVGALEDLVARHPALRTVVGQEAGAIVQQVRPVGELAQVERRSGFPVSLEDLAGGLRAVRHGLAEVLSGAPLFRTWIDEVQEGYALSLAVYHLIYDAWSLALIWRDLGELYSARRAGRTASLPPLRRSYAEYAIDQRRMWAEGGHDAVAFYREVLGPHDGRLVWPRDGAVDDGDPCLVEDLSVVLDDVCLGAVRRLSRAARVTPFLVLMAASSRAVSRICGQPDVIVGVDTASREDPDLQDVVGFFLNSRILHVHTGPDDTVGLLVGRVRDPWMRTGDVAAYYCGDVLARLGDREILQVNMPTMVRDTWLAERCPRLEGAVVIDVDTGNVVQSWRDVSIFWFHDGPSYRLSISFLPQRVGYETARRLAEEIVEGIRAEAR